MTLLDALQAIEIDGVTRIRVEHCNGNLSKYSKALRVWGEADTVRIKQKCGAKISDRGVTYNRDGGIHYRHTDHGDDVYCGIPVKSLKCIPQSIHFDRQSCFTS